MTQFKKYYRDYTAKTNAAMHLNHKPGEIMQVDWAGDTASVIDTDTGEVIPAYVFVSSLPYSGYGNFHLHSPKRPRTSPDAFDQCLYIRNQLDG